MKITAFDSEAPLRLAQWGGASSGSNSSVAGGDIDGETGDLSVIRLNSTVSLGSNLSTGTTIGDVLTIVQTVGEVVARFATPSNSGASFGSNATRVSETASVGALATAAREDHIHDGIGTITASSSNTMQRGTFNLRPGTNVAFGLTDADGDGEHDTLTINASATGGSSSGSVATDTIWDAKGDIAGGTGANTAARLAVGTNGYVLTADSAEATGMKWAAAAGGSGTYGDGKAYIWTPPGTADATDDEFNDDTSMSGPTNGLDAKWTKYNLGTASWFVLDDAVAPGCAYFVIPTGQTAGQMIYQTVPSGDWTYAARFHYHYESARTMLGIVCVSSTGTGVMTCIDSNGTWGVRTVTSWADGGGGTFAGKSNVPADYNGQLYPTTSLTITLRKASGVYSAGWSSSDRLVPGNYFETSHTPSAFTPAYIGFGRVFGGGANRFLLDFFRRIA